MPKSPPVRLDHQGPRSPTTQFFAQQFFPATRTFSVNTHMTALAEHYILTLDPLAGHVLGFIDHHKLRVDIHLNRTRFWVPLDSPLYTDFLLRFGHCCPLVDPTL